MEYTKLFRRDLPKAKVVLYVVVRNVQLRRNTLHTLAPRLGMRRGAYPTKALSPVSAEKYAMSTIMTGRIKKPLRRAATHTLSKLMESTTPCDSEERKQKAEERDGRDSQPVNPG